MLIISLLVVAIILVFIPGVQKKLLQSQLASFVSDFSVEHIAINPFSARIDDLNIRHDDLSIHIGHLDAEYSLFKLLFGRLKIKQLVLEDTLIEDYSKPEKEPGPSPIPLFPGVFPYLNQGLVFDIGHLSLNANYISPATGKINASLSGDNINELTDTALALKVNITELEALPELDHINIDGQIYLNQHLKKAIDAQTTQLKITLQEIHSTPQYIDINLKMAELEETSERWDEFYFTEQHNRYIGKIVKPESIDLNIKQTNSQNKLLSSIKFSGWYNGNNGILQGQLKVKTDRDFLQVFKSMQLPLIESDITADLSYSLITLDGWIDLDDEIKIENLHYQSLPEQFHLKNQLIAEIDKQHLTINKLVLTLTEKEQTFVELNLLQALYINLDNLPAFLETHNHDIAKLRITALPLSWFSDFIADYSIQSGLLSSSLSIAVNNNNILAKTTQPLAFEALTIMQNAVAENVPAEHAPASTAENHNQQPQSNINQAEGSQSSQKTADRSLQTVEEDTQAEPLISEKLIVEKLNLSTDLLFTADANRLELILADFTLSQGTGEQLSPLLKNSFQLEVGKLLKDDIKNKPVKLASQGNIHINEMLALPIVKSAFNQPVPEALSLDYEVKLNGADPNWTIAVLQTALKQKENQNLLSIVAQQPLNLTRTAESVTLNTQGELLSGYMKQIDLGWFSPYIEAMNISGVLNQMDFSLASAGNNDYSLNVPAINLYNVTARETDQQENRILFENINLSSQINASYTPDVISIIYPKLTLNQGESALIRNNGSVIISDYTQPEKQLIVAQGTLNAFVQNIMGLGYIQDLAKEKLKAKALLDAQYHLELNSSNIKIHKTNINLNHPDTKGSLTVKTIKPVSFSLPAADGSTAQDYAFSPNGHLRVTLKNFDSKPYENFLKQADIAFDHINGQLDLRQKNNRQQIIFKTPLKVANLHFLDAEKRPLDPFDLELDLQTSQNKNLLTGEIRNLSLQFIKQKGKALDTQMKFALDLNREIPIRSLEGQLNAILTQWLDQPVAIPENTLQQGSLETKFNIDKQGNIKHYWQINDLIDKQNQQIVKSITIDGTGQLNSASDIKLNLPLNMLSESGQTVAEIATTAKFKGNKSVNLDINGKTVFLNDILKLLDTISPPETVSADSETSSEAESSTSEDKKPPLNTLVDTEPFWKSPVDIDANLSIDKLYQTDYLAFDKIKGKLSINDNEFKAHEISALFHDSPLKLDSLVNFNTTLNKHPYDVNFIMDIKDFNLSDFLKELDPTVEPLIEGIFNVDLKMFGQMDNIDQWRNQLLFDARLVSFDGIYHFIPNDSVLLLSSGYAMALAGEVVSVIPTAGFGLGIMSRMVRFIKDFPYDKIDIHLVRKADKNTRIEEFEIFSPELYMTATGGITFVENERVVDSPMKATARLDLAGEGAAIFYGLNLLTGEKNEYGFWEGPEIIFGGTLTHPTDNFEEIVETAKKGTVQGGITRPFSGIIGDFKYRWFAPKPEYQDAITDQQRVTTDKSNVTTKQSVSLDKQNLAKDKQDSPAVKTDKTTSTKQMIKKPLPTDLPESVDHPFFENNF